MSERLLECVFVCLESSDGVSFPASDDERAYEVSKEETQPWSEDEQ